MKTETHDAVSFALGQTVYFKIKPSESGLVTGILFAPAGVTFRVVWEDKVDRWHFACELSSERGAP